MLQLGFGVQYAMKKKRQQGIAGYSKPYLHFGVILKGGMSMDNPHFNLDDIAEVLENIHKAKKLGILIEDTRDSTEENKSVNIKKSPSPTTTSSLLYDGRVPRADVSIKLRKIAELLQIQSEFYPNFKPRVLEKLIRAIIGNAVNRTVKKYLKCITDLSEKDRIHGLYNVRGFCIQALK